jgi:hypothetical protein
MRREHCAFIDRVSGEEVNVYTDRLGRRWLATNCCAMFRVAKEPK